MTKDFEIHELDPNKFKLPSKHDLSISTNWVNGKFMPNAEQLGITQNDEIDLINADMFDRAESIYNNWMLKKQKDAEHKKKLRDENKLKRYWINAMSSEEVDQIILSSLTYKDAKNLCQNYLLRTTSIVAQNMVNGIWFKANRIKYKPVTDARQISRMPSYNPFTKQLEGSDIKFIYLWSRYLKY